ncbi:glyoxylate/hydroxypyruvate reductase A [Roseivirga sp. E12]|uniref:2-hydroxyacid dehydrogenase n=1 Tax=Roseivirga sp. E12 TaxID=2819237 RepID=UPI001ABD22D3|nr:glyoxylate/hydroxypyruvate reductase A [Roseivirga sp. E12]MBO3697342.1 glyoxylate/hydroxypyruvate reductase A [Roseivirga sp. E12]
MDQQKVDILISSSVWDPRPWVEGLSKSSWVGNVHVWPTEADLSNVEALFVWKPLADGVIDRLPNIKWISSLGAGVDHLMTDSQIPRHISITRIVDPFLARDMTNYVIMGLMMHQRSMLSHMKHQKSKIWERITYKPLKVGVMGLGALGRHLSEKLVSLGFEVFGYSRTRKTLDGVTCYDETNRNTFLSQTEVLVNLLPVTPQTTDILDASLFQKLTKGAFLINVARGNHLVENDLMEALDSEHLSGALLDVFRDEPLPINNLLWEHPKVTITPHVASVTTPSSAIALLLDNLKRLRGKEPLLHTVDIRKGY